MKVYHWVKLGGGRRDRAPVQLCFQYLPAYRDLDKDFGYLEPIKKGVVISLTSPLGCEFWYY